MSMMNCSAAMQAVLDQAAGRMGNLIVIRVDAAPDLPPAALSRRLARGSAAKADSSRSGASRRAVRSSTGRSPAWAHPRAKAS